MNLLKRYREYKHKKHVKNFTPDHVHNLWDNQKGWGWNVYFSDFNNRIITGHHPDRWKWTVGNEVRCKMDSGKIARFEIIDFKPAAGVWDMFFCTVKDLDYL